MRGQSDSRGNRTMLPAAFSDLSIIFHGEDNFVDIHPDARIGPLRLEFHGSHSRFIVGPTYAEEKQMAFSSTVRIGEDCEVRIGCNVSTTARCFIGVSEGVCLTIGDDCMLASGVQLRADDSHTIFDVRTGIRANPSQDIVIGSHVWLADGVRVLKGSRIGNGSVIGVGSVVTDVIPNNCVAVGSPARVVRRDIAWERPCLWPSRHPPAYKPDASFVERTGYWELTKD